MQLFHFWKRVTRWKHLWIRNNFSTLGSQMVDSVVVISVTFGAAFGFTGPWRNLVVNRRGQGTRKTLVMLAAASVTMMLLGAYGGYPTVTHAVGWSLLIGTLAGSFYL